MAGNRHRHGKGWPDYGRKDRKRGSPANYKPRKRGPAQTPPLDRSFEAIEVVETVQIVEEAA